MDPVAAAVALGDALGAGEASDFFPFAETLRGAQTARATTQTLLMISDLFFIVWIICLLSRTRARVNRRGEGGFLHGLTSAGQQCNPSFCDNRNLGGIGGGMGIRTPDLLIANETLYQLSYTPKKRRETSMTKIIFIKRTHRARH